MTDTNPFDSLRRTRPRPESVAATPAVASEEDLSTLALFQTSGTTAWTPAVTATPEPHPGASQDSSDLDWGLVRSLRQSTAARLEEQITQREASGDPVSTMEQRRELALPLIRRVVEQRSTADMADGRQWAVGLESAYTKAIEDSLFGLGRWQPLLEIPTAENIVISGTDPVIVDHSDGSRTTLPPVADSDEELLEQISYLAQNSVPRRAFDVMHTDVTINYQDRFRIHALSNEVSQRPSVAIRQHLHTRIGLGDLVDRNVMPRELALFLAKAVRAKMNILVAGDVGDGKTTTLRALIDAIDPRERFATLETDLELFAHRMPGREWTLVLTARDGMGERNPDGSMAGEIRVGQLIPPALRQAIDRIIVGELRGDETGALFEAMQAGAGAMATLHSPDAASVPERLATMAARSRIYTLEEAQRQIGQSVDLVVHVKKVDGPSGRRRFIQEIRSLTTGDDNQAAGSIIYQADEVTGQTIQFNPGSMKRYDAMQRYEVELNRYEDGSNA